MSSEHKVAVVTGAGSGIGKASALALLGAGWRVALAGRRLDALERAAAESGAEDRALPLATDVTVQESVRALFAAVLARFGRVDLLFNNAGAMAKAAPLDELSLDDWRRVVDVNLTGAFLCTQEAFRIMRRQEPRGGRILNNGSISAHAPRPGSAPYTATKHAITGLTKSTSLDGRAFDIACGQLDIGNALTDLTAGVAAGAAQPDGTIRPEPTMDVAHVARAVVHMAELPLDVNVQFLTILATKMPYLGRG